MSKSHDIRQSSYNQPRHSQELSRGNEIVRRLAEQRLVQLERALRNAEEGGNANLARHGVMPQTTASVRNGVRTEQHFENNRPASVAVQPAVAPEKVAAAASFEPTSVAQAQATVERIYDEIMQARQEWHQGLDDAA